MALYDAIKTYRNTLCVLYLMTAQGNLRVHISKLIDARTETCTDVVREQDNALVPRLMSADRKLLLSQGGRRGIRQLPLARPR